MDWIELLVYIMLLTVTAPLIGAMAAAVFDPIILRRPIAVAERWISLITRIDLQESMGWRRYALTALLFNLVGLVVLLAMQLWQSGLPLNPADRTGVPLDLAFNTAVSFVTNTNWQAYSGEDAMSYFVQMVGLGVQNFVSAATGIAVLIALIRGLRQGESEGIGNFWSDLFRSVMLLLPFSFVLAIFLVSQGVVMNFNAPVISVFDGFTQILPQGPGASQIAIKQLGTNGGGFFGVNSAHPYENPTELANLAESLSILILPAALVFTFGRMIGDVRQGRALFAAMMILFLFGLGVSLLSEFQPNPALGVQAGEMMEGKETRFGITQSVLWSVATTAASNGSVNAMHDSLSPLSGGVALLNMLLGQIVFGGVGSGLYGMILFVVLTVFMTGLMVGRSPEYLGKRIEAFEVKMAMIGVLVPAGVVLVLTGIACIYEPALQSLTNAGPHGFSEILYAFASGANNNGSAFGGLAANTPFYNYTIGGAMLVGRYAPMVTTLAIAGSLARKRIAPPSSGVFPTHSLLFVLLLIGVILIVGALTFFPALTLGPILEHLLMQSGATL